MKKFVCHLLSFVRNLLTFVGITLFLAGSAADPESNPIIVFIVITIGLILFVVGLMLLNPIHRLLQKKHRYNRKMFPVDTEWQHSLEVANKWESKRKQWEDNRNFIRNFIIDP